MSKTLTQVFISTIRVASQGISLSSGGYFGYVLLGMVVPLAYQKPYAIIVYSVAKYRPHLSHFWEYVIFAIPT